MKEPEDWQFECPKGWIVNSRWGFGFACQEPGGLRVLIDCERKDDGKIWLHVSYSRKHWVPTHADTCKVKNAFIGDRYAYAVYPASEKYVNIHPNCLHLWACMDESDGRVLPEFSAVLPEIGRSI